MTSITSSVTRKGRFEFARYGVDKRPVVIRLWANGGENDMVSLRLLGRRKGFDIDLCDLYRLAVRQAVIAKMMKKVRSKRRVARKFARLTN